MKKAYYGFVVGQKVRLTEGENKDHEFVIHGFPPYVYKVNRYTYFVYGIDANGNTFRCDISQIRKV
jgi:hypothetical protein